MYRKIVWCYIIVLTLLDISLNSKLSAQGKTHGNGVSVHESLMEGISLQEWGKEPGSEARGRAAPGDALSLAPRTLAFGRRALAAAHALQVTITNTANETVHLASVAGTTPDFHASFFESKTLAPQANTSFSVVYLGRREGPVTAHLYIHTSKGVHKYPVSAVGVASEWRVWPLVGLRVPLNATLEPLLTLYNPTDTTIQVREVYSSGSWLGLALPDGGGEAPRAQWALPPHATRPLVRLAIQLTSHHDHSAPLTAYIRIKGNMTGGGLVVGVEATPAPAGEFLSPLQLRLRTRGSMDSPDTLFVEAGSSDKEPARLHATAEGACGAGVVDPPIHTTHEKGTHNGAGVKSEASGVGVSLVREQLEPQQGLMRAAQVTLDYAKMWAGYLASLANGSSSANGSGGLEGAYCEGWLSVGRAALPYSLRMLPGTLSLEPAEMHFVTCNKEEAMKPQELIARNQFPEPIRITYVEFPPEVQQLFHTESLAPLELSPGAALAACRLRLRDAGSASALQATLTLHTNLTDYTLPLLLYEGTLQIEWEWPNSMDGTLRLGAVGTSSSRVVAAKLHNAGARELCVTRMAASLPQGSAEFRLLDADRHKGCVRGGGWLHASLSLEAPSEQGQWEGEAIVQTPHGLRRAALALRAIKGRLRAETLLLAKAAPYVWSSAPLQLESTMALRMRVLNVTQPPGVNDPALAYLPDPDREIDDGRGVVGKIQYSPEMHCHPDCYTGLQVDTPEGDAWACRATNGQIADEVTLQLDAELQRTRYSMFTPKQHNFTLHLHTSEVVQVPIPGTVQWAWPCVWTLDAASGARAGLAGVGATLPLRLRAINPAQRPILVQPRLAVYPLQLGGEEEMGACVGCVWSASSFQLGEWRVIRGAAVAHRHNGSAASERSERERPAPYLLMQPGAEVEFTVTFAPTEPADLAAYLYLRNNLTILERVLLTGRGAHPTFELGGRKPNSSSPIVLEVSECGGVGAGVARRTVAVRNTGRVPLRLRGWRVGGQPCQGRAFRLQPCVAARLQPGETHHLQLHYAADWTRSRAQATLSVRVGASLARFSLQGLAPARLLASCAPLAPQAPFEKELRALALVLAVLALIGAAGLGAADAERALRRHRSSREAQPARPPLDLRAIGRISPTPSPCPAVPVPARPAPPPPPPRRRRTPRGRGAGDAAAERLAFSVWRAGGSSGGATVGSGVAPRDESRSSEGEEGEPELCATPPEAAPPHGDAESSSPDSSPPPRESYSSHSRRAEEEEEEEGASSGEDSSSGESRAPPPRSHSPPAGPPAAPHTHSRGSRQRREGAEARRSERKSAEASNAEHSSNGAPPPPRPPPPRPHARKERTTRRRPPSPSPCPAAPRAPSPTPRPAAAPPAAPHPSVRWGASWSDVVSRGNAANNNEGGGANGAPVPLAPIGSDVRRRLGSHSLFYYGGTPAWTPSPSPSAPPAPVPTMPQSVPTAVPTPPVPPVHPTHRAPPGQYMPRVIDPTLRWNEEESVSGGYRSLESLWGSSMEPLAPGASWLWGGAGVPPTVPPSDPVRPPPGFSAPRPVRPYDPFQSLASIWTPAALDWRLDPGTPPPVPGPPPPPLPLIPDDTFDQNGN